MALMVALPDRIHVSVMARKSGSVFSTYSLMRTALLLADLTLRCIALNRPRSDVALTSEWQQRTCRLL